MVAGFLWLALWRERWRLAGVVPIVARAAARAARAAAGHPRRRERDRRRRPRRRWPLQHPRREGRRLRGRELAARRCRSRATPMLPISPAALPAMRSAASAALADGTVVALVLTGATRSPKIAGWRPSWSRATTRRRAAQPRAGHRPRRRSTASARMRSIARERRATGVETAYPAVRRPFMPPVRAALSTCGSSPTRRPWMRTRSGPKMRVS